MAKLLQGLPSKYRGVATIWRNKAIADQKMADLCAMLEHEEAAQDIEDEELSKTAQEVLHVRNEDLKKVKKNKSQKQTKSNEGCCYNCNGLDYYARDCRKPKMKLNESNKFASNKSEVMSVENRNVNVDQWVADTGAPAHITGRRDLFTTFKQFNQTFQLADGSTAEIKGTGEIMLNCLVLGKWKPVTLKDVVYIPDWKKNLFSLGSAERFGTKVSIQNGIMLIRKGDNVVAMAKRANNNTFRMKMRIQSSIQGEANVVADVQTWHERLGHISIKAMREMAKQKLLDGVQIPDSVQLHCEGCGLGKNYRRSFKTTKEKPQVKPGEVIHTDICGSWKSPSFSGKKYFILFKDETTVFDSYSS